MAAYCEEVRKLEEKFDGLKLRHIPRCQNEATDQLSKLASSREPVPSDIFVNNQHKSSVHPPKRKRGNERTNDSSKRMRGEDGSAIPDPGTDSGAGSATDLTADQETDPGAGPGAGREDNHKVSQRPEALPTPDHANSQEVMELEADPAPPPDLPTDWRAPFLDCLVKGKLPDDQTEARRIALRAKTFYIMDGRLFKRSTTGIDQKCILPDQGIELLRDIHAGACGHHAAPRTLVGNAFRQGFYWPTAVADATKIVHSCEGCQFYARQTDLSVQALQNITITGPFAVWGLDMVGPLQTAPGGFTHLLVAVDKFSKWIEARPITTIRSEEAIKFFTDIIHRFGVPNSIITDNGTQFTGTPFLEFCDDHHIRVD
ncbi:unnamed protein product [Urochloa humidicola]